MHRYSWNLEALGDRAARRVAEEPFTAEDIDMSLRSYHEGYGFRYLDIALSSCEAATDFLSYKHQQQRWARGVCQAGLNNATKLLGAEQSVLSCGVEMSAIVYNLMPVLILGIGLCSSLYVLMHGDRSLAWKVAAWSMGILLAVGPTSLSVYYSAQKYNRSMNVRQFLQLLRGQLLTVGLAWAIFFGVWEVLVQSKRKFVVTPKGRNKSTVRNNKKTWYILCWRRRRVRSFHLCVFRNSGSFVLADYPEVILFFGLLAIGGFGSFQQSYRDLRRKQD